MSIPFSAAILKGRGNYACLLKVAKLREEQQGELFGMADADAASAWPRFNRWCADEQDAGGSGDLETAPETFPAALVRDVTAGTAAGMYTIGCTWGYGTRAELEGANEIYDAERFA